jgi:excisionase family DNA binding protein
VPRVFRQQYTRPIPPDAVPVTVKNKKGEAAPAVRFKGSDGKTITAPVVTKGKGAGQTCRVPSPNWYGRVKGERVTLCTNKTAAELMLAELVKKAEMGQRGISDPYEECRLRPLAEHLADFRAALTAKGNTPDYVALVSGRLQALADGCGWRTLTDLSASRGDEWLTRQRTAGRPAPELPVGRDAFTPGETAKFLGVSTAAVRDAVKRHRLPATGAGKARRFPRATVEALLSRQAQGASAQTRNYYRAHLRTFGNWLVRDRRLGERPFRHMEAENTTDRRHDRRELDAGELRRVLETARASERLFRGLTGPDRFHLYATACGTGFRASALASLTPESFDLSAALPTVTLAARHAKNRKTKVQPIPPDLAELLRVYLAGRPAEQPVWGGTWAKDHRGAEMLRADLEAAGIPYVVEGPDGPLFADFHSLRHSYLTLGGRAGIDLRTLQELAGHSTPVLTARYSHRRLYDLAGAVEKLPRLLPDGATAGTDRAALRATGTDGTAPDSGDKSARRMPAPYTLLTHSSGSGQDEPGLPGTTPAGEVENTTGRNSLILQGVAAGGDSLRLPDTSEGDGTRTRNHRIDSPVL